MANEQDPSPKPIRIDEKAPVSTLRKASDELKAKIEEAKARNDMPLDSALGNPRWEKGAADGHLDIPDEDE